MGTQRYRICPHSDDLGKLVRSWNDPVIPARLNRTILCPTSGVAVTVLTGPAIS